MMDRIRKVKRRYGAFVGLAVVAMLATAAAVSAVTGHEADLRALEENGRLFEETSHHLEVESGTSLTIRNVNGPITVIGSDSDRITLTVRKELEFTKAALNELKARFGSQDIVWEKLKKIFANSRLNVAQNPGVVEVDIERSMSTVDLAPTFHFEVRVPHEIALNLRTQGGAVVVSGIEGDVDIASGNGDILCERIAGAVDIRTDNGAIACKHVDGRIVARTQNGPIVVDGRDLLQQQPVYCETGNGTVDFRTGDAVFFELMAATLNGIIKTDFAVGDVEPGTVYRKLAGLVGSGGPKVELKSANGCISINRS